MSIRLILAFAIGFFAAAAVGKALVPWLRKIKAGQAIREDGPTWQYVQGRDADDGRHHVYRRRRARVPDGRARAHQRGDYGHVFCLLFALIFGAIGFLDD